MNVPLSLDPGSAQIASVQFELTLPPGLNTGGVTPDASLNSEGKTVNAGAAFSQAKGNELNIVIGDTRYEAYPPKVKLTL